MENARTQTSGLSVVFRFLGRTMLGILLGVGLAFVILETAPSGFNLLAIVFPGLVIIVAAETWPKRKFGWVTGLLIGFVGSFAILIYFLCRLIGVCH